LLGQTLFDGVTVVGGWAVNVKAIARNVRWGKKRKTLDVIPVGMAEKTYQEVLTKLKTFASRMVQYDAIKSIICIVKQGKVVLL